MAGIGDITYSGLTLKRHPCLWIPWKLPVLLQPHLFCAEHRNYLKRDLICSFEVYVGEGTVLACDGH
jgi:hypothetical protein